MRADGVVRTKAWVSMVIALVLASVAVTRSTDAAMATPSTERRARIATALAAELRVVGGPSTELARRSDSSFLSFAGGRPDRPLTPPSGDDASKTARAFVDRYGPAFGVASPQTALREDRRARGGVGQVVRFRQRVGGVAVLAGELAVQVGADGAVVSTSGEVTTDQSIDLHATVTAASAAATAAVAIGKWGQSTVPI